MTDEEVDTLLSGVEDNQGQVNYEGQDIKTVLINAHPSCGEAYRSHIHLSLNM